MFIVRHNFLYLIKHIEKENIIKLLNKNIDELLILNDIGKNLL